MYTGIYLDSGDFLAQNCIMAKTTVRPSNPHFFKFIMSAAILDGISIPKAFMKDYLEGEKCEGRKATLRTKKGGKSWVINTNGCCFTDGWEDFVREHDLHVGDLLVFRYEGGFTFNVIVFDATMCERLYLPLDSDATNADEQILKEKNDAKGSPSLKGTASMVKRHNKHFTVTIRRSHLRWKKITIPTDFRRTNGLDKPCQIFLIDPKGKYWEVGLRYKTDGHQAYIGRGWYVFSSANRLKIGDVCTLKIVSKDSEKMVMEVSICRHNSKRTKIIPDPCSQDNTFPSFLRV